MTEKHRRFLEPLAQGWTQRGACRELEIHRSTGQMWKNGTTVRRKDGTVKFVPPLEPLAVRVVSPRFLSEGGRVQIANLASRGHGPTAVGQLLERAPSTISRELRRNLHPSGYYRPFHAHAAAAARRRRTHPLKLAFGPLPASLRRTLTWDQGTEMARHLDITADTGARIYFCVAASPCQRGSNENTNGLLERSPKAGLRN